MRRFKGGIGVMVDDLLAAAYTLIVMALLVRFGPAMYFSLTLNHRENVCKMIRVPKPPN